MSYYRNLAWAILMTVVAAAWWWSSESTSPGSTGTKQLALREGKVNWSASSTSLEWEGTPNFNKPLRVYSEGPGVVFVTYAGQHVVHLRQSRERYARLLNKLNRLLPQAAHESETQSVIKPRRYTLVLSSASHQVRLEFRQPFLKAQAEIVKLLDGEFSEWGEEGFGTPDPDDKRDR